MSLAWNVYTVNFGHFQVTANDYGQIRDAVLAQTNRPEIFEGLFRQQQTNNLYTFGYLRQVLNVYVPQLVGYFPFTEEDFDR